MTEHESPNPLKSAERDVVALGIAAAAILLLVATGGAVVPDAVFSLLGKGQEPNRLLVSALLLNIALIIFGCSIILIFIINIFIDIEILIIIIIFKKHETCILRYS